MQIIAKVKLAFKIFSKIYLKQKKTQFTQKLKADFIKTSKIRGFRKTFTDPEISKKNNGEADCYFFFYSRFL